MHYEWGSRLIQRDYNAIIQINGLALSRTLCNVLVSSSKLLSLNCIGGVRRGGAGGGPDLGGWGTAEGVLWLSKRAFVSTCESRRNVKRHQAGRTSFHRRWERRSLLESLECPIKMVISNVGP